MAYQPEALRRLVETERAKRRAALAAVRKMADEGRLNFAAYDALKAAEAVDE